MHNVLVTFSGGYGIRPYKMTLCKGEPMQNFTELYEVERRYEELAHKMSTPDAAADAEA